MLSEYDLWLTYFLVLVDHAFSKYAEKNQKI